MWNSEILSLRARALIFAVVARALGCSSNEAEARRLLNEDGLANDEIDRILDHLASPILDEVEGTSRGPYTGAMGYLGLDGSISLNVVIRTLILSQGLSGSS